MKFKQQHGIIAAALMLFTFMASFSHAQSLVINEIMASNTSTIADEDGDFEDWIEIYNFGSDPVNLEGYGLSDNHNNPFKWVFPEYIIEPGQFLLIWASGKNRQPAQGQLVNGLLREVYEGIPGWTVADLTSHPKYPDNPDYSVVIRDLFEAPVNIGDHYGQRLHAWIKAPVTGQYVFWISSDDNSELHLSTSTSPGDAMLIAQVPGWTNPRQWNKYFQQQSAQVTLQEGAYYYVMALMKEHEGGDNLAVGWQIPGGALQRPIPVEYLYTDRAELHTNFSISAAGEEVILTHPSGTTIDEIAPVPIPADISYGHSPDASGTLLYFSEPTPGESNTSQGYQEILEPPVFSHTAGFYTQNFSLSFSHPDPDVTIIYSLDGSSPDAGNLSGTTYQYKNSYQQYTWNQPSPFLTNSYQSFVYSVPLLIQDRSQQPDKLTQISSTWHFNPNYFPNTPVSKGNTVRASAVKEGAIPSLVVTNTYLMFPEGREKYSLPVVTVSLQETGFFDYDNGIYVAGIDFDEWRAANPTSGAYGGAPANYWRRGDHTEYRGHIELFPSGSDQTALKQDFGVRIHGGWSRAFRNKSLRLYARNRYGGDYFNYAFFPDSPDENFRRLILRNSGNDADATLFRDAAIQKISEGLNFDIQDYQPIVLFVNAEYWGIHNVRERYDKHYLARAYGVDPENLDILEGNASVKEGNNQHYNAMRNYMNNNNMSQAEHYEYIKTQMDVSNFIDYNIAQIFVSNTDWPGNNIDFWRLRTPEYIPDAPPGHDGRWRWLMFDTDFGLGLYGGSVSHNTLVFATAPNGPNWPNPPWSTFVLRTLLTNPEFEHDFIVRFADLLNTSFLSSRMAEIINNMKQVLAPEMPAHIHRWKSPSSMTAWNNNVNVMVNFVNQRPNIQRQHIRQFFGIANNVDILLDVNQNSYGHIRINTIEIKSGAHGLPEQPYPWTGIYFNAIPIELEAIAMPGYAFSHWEGSVNSEDVIITITPAGDISITAYFTESATPEPEIIHYWHFNDLPPDTLTSVGSDYTFEGVETGQITYPGAGAGYMDRRTHRDQDPVSNLNLLMGQQPNQGAVLRARNPSNTRELIIEAASTGFENIEVAFATTRTNNGATTQQFYYSPDAGQSWELLGEDFFPSLLPAWELITFSLSEIPNVNDNPLLQFRILFGGDHAGGSSGNNRFDNLSVHGTAMPPALLSVMPAQAQAGSSPVLTIIGLHTGWEANTPMVQLQNNLNPDEFITALETNVISNTQLSSVFDIPVTASMGLWDLLVGEMELPASFTITTSLPGDANGDGIIDILDLVTISNYILGSNPTPFVFENADINNDGLINILDLVGTANIILGGDLITPDDFIDLF